MTPEPSEDPLLDEVDLVTRRTFRSRCLSAFIWTWVVLLSIAASAAYHITTPLMRRTARLTTNTLVSSLIDGRLHIGHMDTLTPWNIVANHVSFYDPEEKRVIYAQQLRLTPDLGAAAKGILRFSHASIEKGNLWLRPDEAGLPSFLLGFEPTDKTPTDPNAEPFVAIVDDIHIKEMRARGSILGLDGLVVEHLKVHGRLSSAETFEIKIWDAQGQVISPFSKVGYVDRVVGRITDQPHEAFELYAEVSNGQGTEHVQANVSYNVPEGAREDSEPHLALLVHADPILASTVEGLGYDWAAPFQGPIRGHARLFGPVEDLKMRAALTTDAGSVTLKGQLPAQGRLSVKASTVGPLLVQKLMPSLPDVPVEGDVTFTVDENGKSKLRLELGSFVFQGIAVPTMDVDGSLEDDRFVINDVKLPYGGGEVTGEGTVGFDGDIDLRIKGNIRSLSSDPNIRKWVPGAKGSASFEANAKIDANGSMNIDGRYRFRNLKYGPVRAEDVRAKGWIKGTTDSPHLNLDVHGNGIFVSDYPLGTMYSVVRGGPDTYALTGSFKYPKRNIDYDISVSMGSSYRIKSKRASLTLDGSRWNIDLDQLVVGKQDIRFGLEASHKNETITAKGLWRERGDEDIQVKVSSFNLATLHQLLPKSIPKLSGLTSLDMHVYGDLEGEPKIEGSASFTDASISDFSGLNSEFALSYGDGRLEVDGDIAFADDGKVKLKFGGQVERGIPWLEGLQYGIYEGDAETTGISLAILQRLIGKEAKGISGELVGRVHMSGPIDAPAFKGEFTVPQLGYLGWPALTVWSQLSYEYGVFNGRLTTKDGYGELAEAEGSALIDLPTLLSDPSLAMEAMGTSPWRISARVPARDLSTLPPIALAKLPELTSSLRAAASLTLSGGGLPTRGTLISSIDWVGDLKTQACGREANPRLTVVADLVNGKTTAHVRGMLNTSEVLVLDASANTPLDEWAAGTLDFHLPQTTVQALVKNAPAEEVPIFCEHAEGRLNGSIAAKDLFGEAPDVQMRLRSDALRARRIRVVGQNRSVQTAQRTPPFKLDLVAKLDRTKALSDLDITWWNGGRTTGRATLPVEWREDDLVPTIDEATELVADMKVTNTPLSGALSWTRELLNVDGTLDGDIKIQGPIVKPRFDGSLKISDGRVTLASMGQRLRDVTGTIVLEGERVLLQGLRATDSDGTLTANGQTKFKGLMPSVGTLEIETKKFPFREEGSIRATIDSKSTLSVEFGDDTLLGTLKVKSLEVDVPEATRTPQELLPHADINVVGSTSAKRIINPRSYEIAVLAETPFWVRSGETYAVRVTADLYAAYKEPDLSVGGDVRLLDGFFEAYGKRFNIKESSIHFDGGKEFDPIVNIVAEHKLRDSEDAIVSVSITGPISAYKVTLASTITNNQNEIIALLLGGDTRGQSGRQAADLAVGALAGIASSIVGSVIPGLRVNFNASSTGAFFSAGYAFDRIIPEVLRDVVRGFYIEGQYTTKNSDTSSVGTGKLLLEFTFRRNVAWTTTWSPNSWNTDITWQK